MPFSFRSLTSDEPGSTKARIIGLYALLAVFNLAAWGWAFLAFHRFPVLLGTAFLAYSFGLRHAVDADHIAAIDNVTRKLMQQGKQPVSIGLMFSLGHSTIVIFGSVAIAAPVLTGPHQPVGALVLTGPSERITPTRLREIGLALREAGRGTMVAGPDQHAPLLSG